jgi:mono/diheme cytochrome c family protein
MRVTATWGAGVVAVSSILGCATAGSGSQAAAEQAGGAPAVSAASLPSGVTAAMVQAGRALYTGAGQCSTCHGDDGRGTIIGPNLTDREWINIDGSYDAIIGIINSGVPTPKQHTQPMPARGGGDLSADQVRQVAAYVYTLSPRN